jgi:ABC-2 type transport system ATP-binding protein
MIEISHLTKRFGPLTAIDDLSFTVRPGRVTGFLGPNGAGKTTTLRAALGLVRPTAGTVTFDGQPYRALKRPQRVVGASLGTAAFHPGRTARGHLRALAPQAGVPDSRVDEVLGFVGLAEAADRRVGQFSLGMRGRLSLAATLLGDPGTLLLDEPNNGLDPEGIAWIRGLLRQLAAEGRTVLISSHMLSEVEQTVDDVVIIARGHLTYSGTLHGLEERSAVATAVVAADQAAFLRLAAQHGWRVENQADEAIVYGPTAAAIGDAAHAAGLALHQLATRAGGLEATFLALTEGAGIQAAPPGPPGGWVAARPAPSGTGGPASSTVASPGAEGGVR